MAAPLPPRFIPPLYANSADGRRTPVVAVPPPPGSTPAWATPSNSPWLPPGHSPLPNPNTPGSSSSSSGLPVTGTAQWIGWGNDPTANLGSRPRSGGANRPGSAGQQSHNRNQSHPSTPAMTTYATFIPPPGTPYAGHGTPSFTPYGQFAHTPGMFPQQHPGFAGGTQQHPGFAGGTPWMPPQGMGSTPYGQPAQMPWGANWQTQPSPFVQPYQMQPQMGGMGGMGMPMQMGMQMGMPGGMQMGMPGGMPGGMPMGQQGLGINMHGTPQGYFTATPQAPPAAFGAPPPERGGAGGDTMPIWEAGQNYGVPLSPSQVSVLGVKLQLNPLVIVQDANPGDAAFLKWNMLFESSYCKLSTDDDRLSWTNGRDAPATFPRVTALRLSFHPNHRLPWSFVVTARDKRNNGVTCGELIDGISEFLQKPSDGAEYDILSEMKKRAVSQAYRAHREVRDGVPGGRLGHGLRRLDFLCETNVFKGVGLPDEGVTVLPVTFWVTCSRNFGGMPGGTDGPVVPQDE